jgi:uncharacterized protein (DUF4213/DUF364 family)
MTKCCNHHHQPAVAVERPAEGSERLLVDDLIQSMHHPSAVIAEVAVGSHFIGIRADDKGSVRAGLASTLGAVPTDKERQMVADMAGKSLVEAAGQLKSTSAFSISFGAAALNAGLTAPQNQPDIEASQIMAEKGRDGETILVGDFPFTDWLRQQVKTLHLFELQKVAGRTPPDQWDAILGRCRVLGLTGTTLITRAMATYLEKAPQAYTIIIGPTTPLSPVLFSHGADVLAGCQVVSPEPVFEGIRNGMSFREFKKLGVQFIAWSKDTVSP